MTRPIHSLAAATIIAVGFLSSANLASAAPSASSLAISSATPSHVETVQFRGRGGFRGGGFRGGRGFGGVGAGLVAGALIGGALAAPYYYRPYYGPSYYDAPPPAAYGYSGGDAVGYCSQRFRSYDPRSGTYMGYDGLRHPCP